MGNSNQPQNFRVDLNAEMKHPIQLELGTPLDPSACSSGGVRLIDRNTGASVPIDVLVTDQHNGTLSIRTQGILNAGKYDVQVDSSAFTPSARAMVGGVTIGLTQLRT